MISFGYVVVQRVFQLICFHFSRRRGKNSRSSYCTTSSPSCADRFGGLHFDIGSNVLGSGEPNICRGSAVVA